MPQKTIPSPFGPLFVDEQKGHIVALGRREAEHDESTPLLEETARQMAAYFSGDLKKFDLPLAPGGNRFQRDVCEKTLNIPYGETRTYGDIAKALGTYGQPIGQACGGNSIPIIIPCHRVLAAGGLAATRAKAAPSARSRC